jgi:5-carboxymethyl-2-hydroxymuconate isomerase
MPHCIIEYSDNVLDVPPWKQVFCKLHEILVATGEWIESDIKSRAIKHSNFYIGDGSPDQAFITLNFQVLDGRSDEIKKEIAQKALTVLSSYFSKTLKDLQTSITVQVSDIHRTSYCRSINYQSHQ